MLRFFMPSSAVIWKVDGWCVRDVGTMSDAIVPLGGALNDPIVFDGAGSTACRACEPKVKDGQTSGKSAKARKKRGKGQGSRRT